MGRPVRGAHWRATSRSCANGVERDGWRRVWRSECGARAHPGRGQGSTRSGSEPPDAETLAVSLIHELQNIKLGALLHLLTLTGDDDGSLYYAPWRDDPGPLGGFLQGIYAFFGITEFWSTPVGRRRPETYG